MMLNSTKNIFIVGIKGVAMANLAFIMKKMGKNISGSDVENEFITDDLLRKNNISYLIGFAPEDLPEKTDLVVYAASHSGTENPQIVEAKKRNIPLITQPELINEIISSFKNKIAVCGTHGKTTTSSLLVYMLIKLGQIPSYLVGTPQFGKYWGGDFQKGDYFVVEADEYGVNPPLDKRPKFHFLNPDYIICTNIDFDHPDVYRDISSVKEAFKKFFTKNSHNAGTTLGLSLQNLQNHRLLFCYDDPNLREVVSQIDRKNILTYGFSPEADLVLYDLENVENRHACFLQSFSAEFQGKKLGQFSLSIFGEKNILNAAGVVLLGLNLGFELEAIKAAVKDFPGAKRRFELIAHINHSYLFDDYAHHPAEIEATIQAVRVRFPNRRLIIIFQPHTFSRTQTFLSNFAQSLSRADLSVVLDIFPSAREKKETTSFTSKELEKKAREQGKDNVVYAGENSLMLFLEKNLKRGDVIFTMGAGDVYKRKNDIIDVITRCQH